MNLKKGNFTKVSIMNQKERKKKGQTASTLVKAADLFFHPDILRVRVSAALQNHTGILTKYKHCIVMEVLASKRSQRSAGCEKTSGGMTETGEKLCTCLFN